MTVVDIHAHHLPAELGERFRELSGRPYPLRHRNDMTGHLEDMDAAGVERQLLGLGAVQPYWEEESAAAAGAAYANDLYAAIVAERPDRFGALAAVPLPHPAAAAAETARALDEMGFAGVGLGCSAGGIPLDSAAFDEFWAAADDRSAVVYLHPGVANALAIGVQEFPMLLGPVFGSPAETAVAAMRLVLAGHVERYSHVRFVVAAMGGSLLTGFHKLVHSLGFGVAHGESWDPEAIERDLRSLWFDTSSLDEVLALAVRRSVGVDRLVFGSDAPWGKAAVARRELDTWLEPDEARAVLERTSELIP